MPIDKEIRDVKIPFEEDGSGGLLTVTGESLASQRIIYGYSTKPGDIPHRGLWGADLEEFANRTASPSVIQQLKNQANRFLGTLPFLEEFAVEVERDGESLTIETDAVVNGRALRVPEFKV